MKPLNNKGIALVTALMMTLITLAIILGLMYMVTESTKISAAQKRYRNIVEASYGGSEVVAQDIIPQLYSLNSDGSNLSTSDLTSISGSFASVSMSFPGASAAACLNQKLTSKPSSTNWSSCSNVNLNPTVSPDITFTLSGVSGGSYTVYSKIVDTIPGVQFQSSAQNGPLTGGGVAEGSPPTTGNLAHFVYRFEVVAQRSTNVKEQSALSVLYEY